MEHLVSLMAEKPRQRFGIPVGNDFSIWDLDTADTVSSEHFLSKGKSTPFDGWQLFARCLLTVYQGKAIWEESYNGKKN